MGSIKDRAMEFLENGGYNLEYDEWNLPRLEDMDVILDANISVWEYFGQTEDEYYGRDDKW